MSVNLTTTDNQAEQLTQVDEKNIVIGPIDRGDAHKKDGMFYRTIYVLVINHKGEVLLQKRSPTKDLYPNCWDLSVGGHVEYGKGYIETAIRELEEELGLMANDDDLMFKGEVLVHLSHSGEYFYVYEYILKPSDKLRLSEDEVTDTKWMTIGNIKQSMQNRTLQWYERPLQTIQALY